MQPTRRTYLLGAGVAIAGVGTASTVLGDRQDQPQLTIGEIDNEGEWLVLHNEENQEVDISGLWMDWEHGQQEDQFDQFQEQYGATTIGAGGSIKVATGAESVDDADVEFDHSDGDEVMNNEGTDTYAVLTEDRETVIARSDQDRHGETPTETEEETPTETEAEQPTASVTFEDQTTDGSSVAVASVTMSDGGFVAIHDSSLLDGAVLESVVGVSDALDAGTHEGIEVALFEGVPGREFDRDALQEDETLIAMPHFDSNDNGTYDFVTSEGEADGPYTDADGAVTDDAKVTVEDEMPSKKRFVAELSGEGHGIDTSASGRAEFVVDVDAQEVRYTLAVSELCDATMAHIHLGGEGESGPIVVWLYPEDQREPRTKEGRFTGTLAEGTFTEDDLVGPLEGKSFEELAKTHADRDAYVNVHTEEHPKGEIRGQIEPAG